MIHSDHSQVKKNDQNIKNGHLVSWPFSHYDKMVRMYTSISIPTYPMTFQGMFWKGGGEEGKAGYGSKH